MPSDAHDHQPGNSPQQKGPLDGELSTWLVTVLVHASPYFVLGLYCVWRVC